MKHTHFFKLLRSPAAHLFNLCTIVALIGLAALLFFTRACAAEQPLPVVAITQIVAHPSLDQVHDGILDALESEGFIPGKTVKILDSNANGSIALAGQIAKRFTSLAPDVMVGIATPSAQALLNASKNTDLPVVFATVTDPIAAGLVEKLQTPGGRVTGTRNVSPMAEQLELILSVLPETKTIGVPLNLAEPNSMEILNQVRQEASRLNLQVIDVPVSTASEIPVAARSLVKKADAIFLIQDNTVASALPGLLKIANSKGTPVFSSYVEAVEKGALMGLAFDEYAIGQQTGRMIVRILNGEKPGHISVEDPEKIELAINARVAEALGVDVSGPSRVYLNQ